MSRVVNWIEFYMQLKPKKIWTKQGHTHQGRAGFTLLEIMVALSVMTFALIAIFQLYTQTISMSYRLSFNTRAPFLAQKIMTQQTSMPGDELGDNSGDFGEKFPGYTWAVSVEDLVPEVLETDDLKKIDVRVFLNGDEQTYDLRRYRFLRD